MRIASIPAVVFLSLTLVRSALAAESSAIPPHQPLALIGLHAYCEKTIVAGETLHVRVSSTQPYEFSVCRLGPDIDGPTSDTVLTASPESPPVFQPIHPGSYVHVEEGLPADEPLAGLTLECWVRPWRLDVFQGLVTQYDYPQSCGFGLFLANGGGVQFYTGNGKAYQAAGG